MLRYLPLVASYLAGKALGEGAKAVCDRKAAVQDFAASIAWYIGVKAAFLASTGRAALNVVLRALMRRPPALREVARTGHQ